MNVISSHFCYQCRAPLERFDEVIFVRENDTSTFCSSRCISIFYNFLSLNLQEKISKNIEVADQIDSILVDQKSRETYIDFLLKNPEYRWHFSNKLEQNIVLIFKKFSLNDRTFFLGAFCFYHNEEPSFVITAFTFLNVEQIQEFLDTGEPIDIVHSLDYQLDPSEKLTAQELIDIECKKSYYLSYILNLDIGQDIEWERHITFHQYLKETLQKPQEVYDYLDEDGDRILSYISLYNEGGKSFYYIIIMMLFPRQKTALSHSQIVLSLPTERVEVYKHFSRGNLIVKDLKN